MFRADPELSYRTGPFGKERFLLRETDVLVSVRTLTRHSDFALELRNIGPRFVRHKQRPLGWVSLAALCAVAGLACLVWTAMGGAAGYVVPALAGTVALLAGSAACAVRAARVYQNAALFYDAFGGPDVLTIAWEKPDAETFREFVGELQSRIEHQHEQADRGGLAAELRGLEKLRTDGMINDQEFRAAKASLLGLEPWQLTD